MESSTNQIDAIRHSSRALVRSWGILESHVAGTKLSLSEVHAILEIGSAPVLTAKQLSESLMLNKSSVSRFLKNLIDLHLIDRAPDPDDKRQHRLSLTSQGKTLFGKINDHACERVIKALSGLDEQDRLRIQEGLEMYAEAMAHSARREGAQAVKTSKNIEILNGYCPGLIGQVTTLHSQFYHTLVGFGPVFETLVAGGLSKFIQRLDSPLNDVWHASVDGKLLASIALDGEDLGEKKAHLRWFIVDDTLRGKGIGRKLLQKALAFADAQDFKETHLSTFMGLDAARHLYETEGFILASEQPDCTWGTEVIEQQFVRMRP